MIYPGGLRLNLGDGLPAFCLGSVPFLSGSREQLRLPESQEMGEADLCGSWAGAMEED